MPVKNEWANCPFQFLVCCSHRPVCVFGIVCLTWREGKEGRERWTERGREGEKNREREGGIHKQVPIKSSRGIELVAQLRNAPAVCANIWSYNVQH